jgi:hypothetical protein
VLPKLREWSPRLWEGCDLFAWLRILLRNNAAVELPYWYIATIVGGSAFTHSCLRWLQAGRFGREIATTPLTADPIFVIGHWRTGTTLLHELLILDDRHTFPDTFACFVPHHILLTEPFFKQHLRFLMPEKRPMDNMATGWERPQEDEFALCLMGQPSPYADLAFPNRETIFPGSLDLSGLSARQLRDWKKCLHRFLQTLTFRDSRRLVLKSPPHTARIGTLLEMYPHAKFVHITRDPRVLFASTVKLWKSLCEKHELQKLRNEARIQDKVLSEFRVIYERFFEMRDRIPPGNLVEVRYEDFVTDLVGGMQRIYDQLSLGGFDSAQPRVQDYANRTRNYEPNKHRLTTEQLHRIDAHWGDLIAKLGY